MKLPDFLFWKRHKWVRSVLDHPSWKPLRGREAACNCLHSQTGEVHRQPVLSVDVQISGDWLTDRYPEADLLSSTFYKVDSPWDYTDEGEDLGVNCPFIRKQFSVPYFIMKVFKHKKVGKTWTVNTHTPAIQTLWLTLCCVCFGTHLSILEDSFWTVKRTVQCHSPLKDRTPGEHGGEICTG